jgi:hypothetical protein
MKLLNLGIFCVNDESKGDVNVSQIIYIMLCVLYTNGSYNSKLINKVKKRFGSIFQE